MVGMLGVMKYNNDQMHVNLMCVSEP